ncbi:MAG: glycosyltransferase family 4 protein [Patescibacteria group bacterium]|nr:glycosyltransferase family 4 protein [Patescibacteria group bacterium]
MPNKKHILMLTGDSGIAAGKQNVFFEMLRGFSKHWERVSVICPSNGVGKEIVIHNNVHLYPSGMSRRLHLDFFRHKGFVLRKAREIFAENPFDIISAHVIPPLFANACAAAKLSRELKVPYVAELMHIPGYPKAENFSEKIEKFALDRFLKKNGKQIPHMRLINKHDTHDYVVAAGFPEEKILYIPAFYLDFDLFKPDGVRKDKQFVFAGRLEKNKGLDLLLDAADMVAKEEPDFRLKIIGDGSMKDFVEKRTSKNIELLGWLPTRDDVARAYQESTGIVMTSYNEGGPRVTLEAMACGAICISTPVGVMQDFGRDHENLLFTDWSARDIAEKILWAIRNREAAAKIAEQGKSDVKQFEYNAALKFYAERYYDIIVS